MTLLLVIIGIGSGFTLGIAYAEYQLSKQDKTDRKEKEYVEALIKGSKINRFGKKNG